MHPKKYSACIYLVRFQHEACLNLKLTFFSQITLVVFKLCMREPPGYGWPRQCGVRDTFGPLVIYI